MEIFELRNLIMNNECPNLLIFVGEDYALSNIYIKQISEKYNLKIRDVDSLGSVLYENSANELFPEDKLFVLKYCKDAISEEENLTRLKNELKYNKLVMVFEQLDKRVKFYTQNKDIIVSMSPQEEKTFKLMVKSDLKLSAENISQLSKICGCNYGRYKQEIDKIKQYADANNIDYDTSFNKLIENSIIKSDIEDVAFDFVNRVLEAKKDLYKYYMKLKSQGESNIKLLGLLYLSFRNQFIVQTVKIPTTESTGLNQYIINMCRKRSGVYTEQDLRRALDIIQKVEQGRKSGVYDEQDIIDIFLIEAIM